MTTASPGADEQSEYLQRHWSGDPALRPDATRVSELEEHRARNACIGFGCTECQTWSPCARRFHLTTMLLAARMAERADLTATPGAAAVARVEAAIFRAIAAARPSLIADTPDDLPADHRALLRAVALAALAAALQPPRRTG